MRKLFICMVSLFLTLAVSASVSQAGDKWKIGHVRPADSAVDKDIRKFAEAVSTGSGKEIEFSIYPASKLGDYSFVQERVSFGEVEMFLGPFGTGLDRRVSLAWTPFLVEDWETAEKLYSAGSPLLKKMEIYLKGQNIKILGGWPVYFGGIGLTKKVSHATDPDVLKKAIIRVPPIRCFEIAAEELGYTPYPITWKYAKMGLKTGMVGGLIGGGAEGYAALADSIRYYLPVRDHFEYWFLYMNLDLWDSLSAEKKQLLQDAARTMEKERYKVAKDEEAASISELKKRGVTILEIGSEEYARMKEKVKKSAWPAIREDVGSDFDEIVEFIKAN